MLHSAADPQQLNWMPLNSSKMIKLRAVGSSEQGGEKGSTRPHSCRGYVKMQLVSRVGMESETGNCVLENSAPHPCELWGTTATGMGCHSQSRGCSKVP